MSAGASGTDSQEQGTRHDATPDGSERATPGDRGEPGARVRSDDTARDERRQRDPTSAAPAATPGTAEPPPHESAAGPASDETGSGAAVGEVDVALDDYERTILTLLAAARDDMGAPDLQVDADLVRGARERACTMASGATPLLAEDDTENIGLVVEIEPDAAATAMHDWWTQSSGTRSIRLAPGFTRYGVGACPADDRVYYSERFGS